MKRRFKRVIDTIVGWVSNARNIGRSRVVHEGFPQSVQLNGYSCGLQCAWMTVNYFTDKDLSFETLKRKLRATKEFGTQTPDLVRVLRKYGLRVSTHKRRAGATEQIRKAIRNNAVVLAVVPGRRADEEHWIAVYGFTVSPPKRFIIRDPAVWRALLPPRLQINEYIIVRQ